MTEAENKATILLVDDDPTFINIIAYHLEKAGFSVLKAANSDQALLQAREAKPDIILLDVMMPGVNGFETCRQLKADKATKAIPVIFLTALSDTVDKVKGLELGAVDYLTKSVQGPEIIARINNHLTICKLQKDLQAQNNLLQEENIRRMRVQEALKESRERYRLLADNSTDIISRQTPDGIYRYVSPACHILLGYQIEEMIGQPALEFIHPDDRDLRQLTENDLQSQPPVSTVTYRARRKNGSFIWLETTNRIIREPKRKTVLEIISVSRDITERKEAEEALQKARDELERRVEERTAQLKSYSEELKSKNEALSRLDKLKDEFLANTSHELRTPLNGIIGIAESMIDGVTGQLSPQQVYNLSMIVSSGHRLTNLVNDILDFSKLKHRELILDLKPVDMHAITDVVLILSQPIIGSKSLKLVNQIDPHLALVQADENRAQQIMHNLIGNAIKFTDKGTITVSTVGQDDLLAITVADTGIGIPADKFETVFQSFEQVDASITRTYGGTGLGLPISKKLVELHGGTIHLTSTIGMGTQVTFTLPLYKGPVEAKQKVLQSKELMLAALTEETMAKIEPMPIVPSHELAENSKFTILVADDELINVQVLTNYLSMQNYNIAQAFDGAEALDAFEEIHPDLVLLDVMMPKISGFEACRKIREKHPAHELPIVLVTAKNQISDLVAGFEAGANDYLTKPFDKSELLTRTKTHLRLSKINAAYGRFVPQEFLQFLDKESIVDVSLGDQVQRDMTILFSDIRSFTSLSESMTPQENFNFLNSYLNRVSPVIRQHGGFIDKYIGDAVMALFPESIEAALQAAIDMQREVGHYNQDRSKEGYNSIRIGIGIHTGSLMLGTIGEERRMEGTVISDAVNLAARLEGLTKMYGSAIIVSGSSLFGLGDRTNRYHYRFLDRVQVKGKKSSIAIFEILDGDTPAIMDRKLETLPDFEQALLHYHSQEFQEATHFFEQVLRHNPADVVTELYLQRTAHFLQHGTPTDWEGVEILTEKH
jgi:two-component system sensor histidine kinase ChiS